MYNVYVFVTAVYYIHVYHDVFLQSLLDVYTIYRCHRHKSLEHINCIEVEVVECTRAIVPQCPVQVARCHLFVCNCLQPFCHHQETGKLSKPSAEPANETGSLKG